MRRFLCSIKSHEQPLTTIDCSAVDDTIITAGADDVIQQLSLEDKGAPSYTPINAIELPSIGAGAIRYRHDGKLVASARWDHTIRIFEAKRLKPLAVLRFHRGSVYTSEYIKHGSLQGYFVSGSKDSTIAVWDVYAISGES